MAENLDTRPVKERAEPKPKVRVCVDCETPRPGRPPRKAPYVGPRCLTHHRIKKGVTKQQRQEADRARNFGLPEGRYGEIYRAQGELCAICGPWTGYNGATRSLSIDHDHDCCPGKTSCGECVRGLLCKHCNDLLGRIADDPVFAQRLLAYLLYPPAQYLDRWTSFVMDLVPTRGRRKTNEQTGDTSTHPDTPTAG